MILTGRAENTFSFRVTINVEHNGALYSGSKVWSIRAWAATSPISLRQARWSVVGEAIPVDVGDLGRLYFLKRDASNFSTDTFGGFVTRCAQIPYEAKYDIGKYVESLSNLASACSVDQVAPIFVRAGSTAESVSDVPIPWTDGKVCAATCLISIIVDKTDEPVSRGIADELPWLKQTSIPTARIGGPDQRAGGVQATYPPYYRQDFINEEYEGTHDSD